MQTEIAHGLRQRIESIYWTAKGSPCPVGPLRLTRQQSRTLSSLVRCPKMKRCILSISRFFLATVLLIVAVMLMVGCGGGDSEASSGDVTVETDALSKAEFLKQADAICTRVRGRFTQEYTAFFRSAKLKTSQAGQEEFLDETIEKVVLPNYEDRMIDEVATLGAPRAFAPEVSNFLDTLQRRLDEIQEDPQKLINTAFPFAKAAKAAEDAGLDGCAKSFS